jgi:uncharacterized membrane protein
MARTIGNPLSWSVDRAGDVGRHLRSVAELLGGEEGRADALPKVRRITYADLRDALRKGVEDFSAFRTDVFFLVLIYPAVGVFLTWAALDRNLLPLIFPAISGFALIGPVAAVGLYEMSRRREKGQEASWADGFNVIGSPSFGAIFVLGLFLVALFFLWIMAASGVYGLTMGPEAPESVGVFLRDLFATSAGWTMIVVGCGVGFLFAVVALAASVVSFPLLLDRPVGLPIAVVTSVRVTMMNPGPIAAWGLIVAAGLAVGTLPVFLGLILVMPVLGHATWHLYRKAVVPPEPVEKENVAGDAAPNAA